MIKRTLTGLALTFLLSACPGAPPPPEPPELPEPKPDPITRGVSKIEGELEDWTLGSAFITFTGGYDVEGDNGTEVLSMTEPTYTGELNEDGTFSVDIASEPVDPEDLFSLGCTADSPEVAALSIGLISETGTIAAPADAIAEATLRPNPDFFPVAMWLYAEDGYSYSGACDETGNNLLSLAEVNVEFVAGWNAVIMERVTEGARISTAEIPDTYSWMPPF